MNFTDNEIALSKQLKEAGLEWKPEIGDHYIYNLKENKNSIVTDIDYDHGDKGWVYVRSPFDGIRNINLCCWLPSWHQCRGIFKKATIELTISDMPKGTEVTLTLWKRYADSSLEFYQQISADTDLEAMYQAIGKLHNERN